MIISAQNLDFQELNRKIRYSVKDVCIEDCNGQRFIGSGLKDRKITVYGTPGNALGTFLDGGEIHVYGNAQDAVGDTMNNGRIVIHGNAGDALGYAMRGGCIYVRADAGYRTGIHMKEFQNKKPVIVVGGRVGSFAGEYLAGGILIVLGIESSGATMGNFAGTGMHGGKIFVRSDKEPTGLSDQVTACVASADDLDEIAPYLSEFHGYFDLDPNQDSGKKYYIIRPDAKNLYKQLYVAN